MIYARQSTAIIVTVGPTLDADGVAVTGGVVGDYKISKNGGAPAALNASATYTHRHTGYGSLSLTASDVDTVGTVEITMDDTTNACPMKEIQVLEPAVYDALFADTAAGYQVPIWSSASATVSLTNTTVATVTTTTTATNVTTVNGLATGVITAAAIATGAIDADALAADAGTEIGTAVWATAARTLTAATNITSNGTALALTTAGYVRADLSSFNNEIELMTDQAASNFVSFFDNASGAATIILSNVATATALDAVDNFLDTEIAALTTELAKVPKSDSNVTWNATALASIQTEANDALVANNLDHLVLSAVDTNFATTVHLDSVIGHLADAGTTATFDRTTDALEVLGAATAPSAATIADAVWDEALSGHLAAGSTGEALNAAGSAGDPWTTSLPGAYTGSQAGKMLSDILTDTAEIGAAGAGLTNINLPNQTMDIVGNITGNLSGSVGSVTGAVGSVTGNVGGNVVGSVASVTGAVGSVTGTVGGIAGTITTLDALDTAQDTQHSTTQTAIADVPTNAELATALGTADDAVLAAIAALNNVSNASVATAVLTTAMTEAYRSTGGTGTVAQLLYEIIAHLGEKSISGTTLTLKKLDGSTTAKTYTLNDATTPTSITETT